MVVWAPDVGELVDALVQVRVFPRFVHTKRTPPTSLMLPTRGHLLDAVAVGATAAVLRASSASTNTAIRVGVMTTCAPGTPQTLVVQLLRSRRA